VKPVARIPLALVALLSGIYLLLIMLLGAPSFWYGIAAVEILIAGVAGFVSSRALGAIALPPMAVLTVFLLSANVWNRESAILLAALACLWLCIAVSLLGSGRRTPGLLKKCLVLSTTALALGFAVDRLFTNKLQIHDDVMKWSVGGNDVLDTGPEKFQDQTKVVIYRQDHDATCYDALYSNELASYLASLKKTEIHVQYEVFYDFGKSRAYNVRSIEGMIITRNMRPVLNVAYSEGGTIQGPNATAQCER
jgi:hypothetical protein